MSICSPNRTERNSPWLAVALASLWCASAVVDTAVAADVAQQAAIAAGRRIYLEGVLPSGQPLYGLRQDQGDAQGAGGACVNCHRRSGLGTLEGVSLVPPITVKYLRRPVATNATDLDMSHVEGFHQHQVPYSDATLAVALRAGVASDGRTLSVLMPRYPLDATAMEDLLAYLGTLGAGASPGVSETELQFATVITPDADPVEREAMLSVMRRFFANQSEVIAAETRPMKASREIRYRVTRRWRLHIWELQGAADSWEKQLHDHMAVEPVFAVLSGLGRSTWEPIHRFCESEKVPCLFPNIDVPVVNETDFYSAYFSRGVYLEADLLAGWLESGPASLSGVHRIIQVYRRDDAGVAAAAALRAASQTTHREFVDRPLPAAAGPKDLAAAMQGIRSSDALMLWLRPADLQSLPPPPSGTVMVSGLMGGLESAPLPKGWRSHVHMSYPVDLPERRLARMNFPYGWFKVQQLPLLAERVQIDTYLACVITSETVGHLFDSFVPDFLMERLEMMISRRLANAYFPRLGLGSGQRFASKGGYVVHFDENSAAVAMPATANAQTSRGIRVIADGDWMTP
jgi:hypothetical protein